MRILVTGGAGFLGSRYVRAVLSAEYPELGDAEVTVLDRLTRTGNLVNLGVAIESPRLTIAVGDVCDPDIVDEVVRQADILVHVAAESHPARSVRHAAEFVRTNVVGTQTVLDAALRHEVGKIVHVSTDEVYGSSAQGAWTEQDPLRPNTPFAASKAGADHLARAWFRTHGLPVCIVRGSYAYGPFQHPERMVARSVTRVLSGRRLRLYGQGQDVRDWMHVDDHCLALERVVEDGQPGETYNVGSGESHTTREVTESLLRALGVGWDRVDHVDAPRGVRDRRQVVNVSKIRRELGFSPQVHLDDGLASTVEWYRGHRHWWEPLVERLGESW